MKTAFWMAVGSCLVLAVATQLPPSAEVVESASRHFTADDIAVGRTFAWERRWIFWGNVLVQLGLFGALALTALGTRLTVWSEAVSHGRWLLQVALLGAIAWCASWGLSLPFRLVGNLQLRAWDMTSQPLSEWFRDQVLQFAIATVAEGLVFLGLYALMRLAPRFWWLLGGLGSVVVGLVYAFLLPAVVAPLFNTFTPLEDTEWRDLGPRIRDMATQAGAGTSAIYVVDASRQSHHSNAYFTGVGSHQRIVLYDNLLRKHATDEVETVVGHELGHWWHRHILQGLFLGGVGLTVGLLFLSRYLQTFVAAGLWRSVADPSGVFLVLLVSHLAVGATWPVQGAISRRFERQADEAALVLSRKPQAFLDAEIRLAKVNKMNVTPTRLNVLLFASHPPVLERIGMAEAWRTNHGEK